VTINQLKTEKEQLQVKATGLESKVKIISTNLGNMTKSAKMLNTGTAILGETLKGGKHNGDSTGIECNDKHQEKRPDRKSVPAQKKSDSSRMWSHPTPHQKPENEEKLNGWRCHYYEKNDHIKPVCHKLYEYPKKISQDKTQSTGAIPKEMWKPKKLEVTHIDHTLLRTSSSKDWYLDNGCSRYMTGVEKLLTGNKSYTTYYDEAKG
jgi:hypothetical protein